MKKLIAALALMAGCAAPATVPVAEPEPKPYCPVEMFFTMAEEEKQIPICMSLADYKAMLAAQAHAVCMQGKK